MKTAVIYARYSCDNQSEQSIEGQLRVCEDYAKQHDILILGTYIDRATTGTNAPPVLTHLAQSPSGHIALAAAEHAAFRAADTVNKPSAAFGCCLLLNEIVGLIQQEKPKRKAPRLRCFSFWLPLLDLNQRPPD